MARIAKILGLVAEGLFVAHFGTAALASPGSFQQDRLQSGEAHTPLLASSRKKHKKSSKGVREKIISREATLKSKDQTSVDFDSVDIGGERKTPMGTLINQNKADKNYDFVKIRLRWHPEMVQSATSLDNGDTK